MLFRSVIDGSGVSVSLNGDVTGSSDNNTVIKWQNLPVENISSSLINGDVYTWNAFANTWTNYQNGGDYSVIVQLPLSGTNGSTTITDLAPVSYAVNPYGGAAISTTKEKWSLSGSLYFDGNGDYLAGGTNDLLAFGANDWTAEFWINPDSGYGSGGFSPYACGLIDFRYDGYGAGWLILLDTSGHICLWWSSTGSPLTSTATISANAWTNVVVQHRGSNIEIGRAHV